MSQAKLEAEVIEKLREEEEEKRMRLEVYREKKRLEKQVRLLCTTRFTGANM